MPESYKVEFPRVVSFAGGGGGGGGGPITSADITDATVTGKALLTALNAAAARLTLLLGTAATLDVPSSGDATSGQVVKGNDSRLTDARTPLTHTHTASQISDATAAGRALLVAVDVAAQRLALALGTSAVLDVPAAGDATSGQVVKGNDTRLTNARTPTAHTHTPSEITGSTTIGRSVLTAADAAAILTLLGINSSITLDSIYLRNPGTGSLVKLQWSGSTDDSADWLANPQ